MTQIELNTIKITLHIQMTSNLPSSSISLGSGLAGFVSGLGSISPGLSLRGSSAASSPSSFFCA